MSSESFKAKDQVAFVKIWTEFIKKERDLQIAREKNLLREFRVDVKKICVLPPKINNFNPRHVADAQQGGTETQQTDSFHQWRGEIEKCRRGPKEKFYFSQTEAHEVGWMMKKNDLKKGRSKSKWRFGRTKSDVVAYADNYALAMGANPYAAFSANAKKA